MSRYIDVDLTLELKDKDMNWVYDLTDLEDFLAGVPTADVVEVRHGHWIEHTEKPCWLEDDVEVFYNCSECGTSHWSIAPPYCPECGAKMDGERKEE